MINCSTCIVEKKDLLRFAGLILVCSLAGLLAPLHWFFDLFNHFRPQAVLAALILLPVSLWLKDKRGMWLAVVVVVLNSILIAQRIYAFLPPVIEAPREISLLSANVFMHNHNFTAAVALVKEKQPDIFVTVETNAAWIEGLKEIETIYPYRLQKPREDYFGMAIYSKIPFTGEALEAIADGPTLLRADFKGFTLLVLHPPPPVGHNGVTEMLLYLNEMKSIAGKTTVPLVVAGDMNTTLWSENAKFFSDVGMASASSGLNWTWPAKLFPLATQIDHVFVRGVAVRGFEVAGDIDSDHFPVMARLGVKE